MYIDPPRDLLLEIGFVRWVGVRFLFFCDSISMSFVLVSYDKTFLYLFTGVVADYRLMLTDLLTEPVGILAISLCSPVYKRDNRMTTTT